MKHDRRVADYYEELRDEVQDRVNRFVDLGRGANQVAEGRTLRAPAILTLHRVAVAREAVDRVIEKGLTGVGLLAVDHGGAAELVDLRAAAFRQDLRERDRDGFADLDARMVRSGRDGLTLARIEAASLGHDDLDRIEEAVRKTAPHVPALRVTTGKKIFEFRPDFDWDKGQALLWLLRELDLFSPDVVPVYLGDDTTDEDAFR